MENPRRRRAKNASAIIEGKEHYPMNQHNGLRRKLEKYAIPNLYALSDYLLAESVT